MRCSIPALHTSVLALSSRCHLHKLTSETQLQKGRWCRGWRVLVIAPTPEEAHSPEFSKRWCHRQYTNVTDRRTDIGRQQRPRLRIASRGKNASLQRVKFPRICEIFSDFSPYNVYMNETRICAAEMAVRYAALIACRKVRMPSVRAEKYILDASG